MEDKNRYPKGRGFAIGLAMGIPLGMPIGLVLGNLALGPAIGVAIGAGLGMALERAYRKREDTETPEIIRRRKITIAIIFGLLALGVLAFFIAYYLARANF
jgi:hypothetical protein